ncbi:nicotinamide mononucleotide transporter [Pseudodesulfovibrio indicus]|uniref:nicotinamide mononucleotide transporter n=1 Tax=Pseudodesulfovibrio indicus TaxID=1716143 RepID=UPI00292DFA50|nr:nicotinamide mononucleotide transporter [Pseudodesulfovibrio indicus]
MDSLLQIWGGSSYLLNKICFAGAERSSAALNSRKWRLWSWIVYLAGLPAWVTVFILERNWIAAMVEAGGAPAMLIGLIIALRGHGSEPRWLDWLARLSVVGGLLLSLHEFGGITTAGQVLELCIAAGFLMGTYLMAKENVQGYLWFMLGNVSCAALMGLQGYSILMAQQLVSLVFVADAWRSRKAAKGRDSSTR